MRNLLLVIRYDGARYHGWQVQQNAVTVQQVFQDALERILGERPDVKGCSRTDAFVHALEFCVSFRTERGIPCGRLVGALNHFLPEDIAVLSCREVPVEFHARYSCTGKEYQYLIWNRKERDPFLRGRALHYWYPLDLGRLNRAAAFFLGAHDFTSFCPPPRPHDAHSHKVGMEPRGRPGAVLRRRGRLSVPHGADYGGHDAAHRPRADGAGRRGARPRRRRPRRGGADRAAAGPLPETGAV
jgi:tRNA pseudouridine(38-40) synthase